MNENLYLVYIKNIGINSDDNYEYDFYYSETPDTVWGEDWNEQCPSACGDMTPETETYSVIERVVTDIPFICAQEQSCFSLQDCIDGCIALAFEDISNYDDYPEPYRLVFKFGEEYETVKKMMEEREK